MKCKIIVAIVLMSAGLEIKAQDKLYWGNTLEGAVFSTSVLSKTAKSDKISTLRSGGFLNIGLTLNYDFSNVVGVYTGLNIKNIGFIEKDHTVDSTIKRRAYTVGIPVGIKIGNMGGRKFVYLGGGVDLPFNYKEKHYVRRGNKDKFNEWFSERTPTIMPYAFIGASFHPGFTVKLQYYPQNFLNPDYLEEGTTVKPYAGYNVNLILLSLGVDIHHHKTPREEVKQQ
jgi:hypothetical protein